MISTQVNILTQNRTIIATTSLGYTTHVINRVYAPFKAFALANGFELTDDYLIKHQLKQFT